ncbi:MAG: alpha/beta hydrolase [Methylococcaceae bacterium]|nr:alpha/beta hydrolase [Methylococcaceae bacterium]
MRGLIWGALVLLQACSTPAQRLQALGAELGFSPLNLSGKGFRLEAFQKPTHAANRVLHVYLEGDGRPWQRLDRIAPDPTPRKPLMLRLMALDDSPALYLARPCYNGHARDEGCSPLLWTQRRYAPEVVDAMTEALRGFLSANPHDGLVFLGHSGGGVLALLLAGRFPETLAVLTLAANYDIHAWADHHGYSRLEGSLNPSEVAGSGPFELHYLGEKDEIVPPSIFKPLLERRRNAKVETVAGFDHACCWDRLWPKILSALP